MSNREVLSDLHSSILELDDPSTLKLLNVDESALNLPNTTNEYVERCKQWRQLRDVVETIPQLLRQDTSDAIPLVGLLGHFSSGKSTLINTLMGISKDDNPPYKRPSGRNPTDTGITLTTHRDLYQKVSATHPSHIGKLQVVQGPNKPLLEVLTLVDTPGLGNDSQEMEMVIQFLHLVHVLVITIDSTRPFSDKEKDFELLDVAFNKLVGVPKVLVSTNAYILLPDLNDLDFQKNWDSTKAEVEWQETLERLYVDKRFAGLRETFEQTPHHFVDSVDGFQVQDVVDTIIPIVSDAVQTQRTNDARSKYVLNLAIGALTYLEQYVVLRSNHLTRLRSDVELRAENTQTAIAELLDGLAAGFQDTLQRLQVEHRNVAELNLQLNSIVTLQAVTQGINFSKIERTLRSEVGQFLKQNRTSFHRSVIENYRSRVKGVNQKFQTSLLDQVEVADMVKETELRDHFESCIRQFVLTIGQQQEAKRISGLSMLDGWAERMRILNAMRDIEEGVHRFERIHDDSIGALVAYVTAPKSIDLLREHGFVGFDDSGQITAIPKKIEASSRDELGTMRDSADTCREALKSIYDKAKDAQKLDFTPVEDESTIKVEAAPEKLELDYVSLDTTIEQIRLHIMNGIDALNQSIDSRILELVKEREAQTRRKKDEVHKIWSARIRIIFRLIIVAIGISGLILGVEQLYPESIPKLLANVPEGWAQGIVGGVVGTGLLGVLGFVGIGFTNPGLKAAFGSTLRRRFIVWKLSYKQKRRLQSLCDEWLSNWQADISGRPIPLDNHMHSAVLRWIQSECVDYKEAEEVLQDIRAKVNERTQKVAEFVAVASPLLADLPAKLKDHSDEIRSAAINSHIDRIREAAESVEDLRVVISRIVANARP